MRITRLFLFLFISGSAFAGSTTVDEAFQEFFDSSVIDSNLCGVNTQKFMAYLVDNQVQFENAKVISVHEDFGSLNHFDARWGSVENYENGQPYRRSNWYFHVFAIVDGKAYDFSQAGAKTQKTLDYLTNAYLPAFQTGNIFFQGRLNKTKLLKKYMNMELNVYDGREYAKEKASPIYSGTFIELFAMESNTKNRGSFAPGEVAGQRFFEERITNADGSVTFTSPKLKTDQGLLPMLGYPVKICQAFGFMGALPAHLEFKITDKKPLLKLYTTIKSDDPFAINADSDILVSFNLEESDGFFSHAKFHFATKVTCANLSDLGLF